MQEIKIKKGKGKNPPKKGGRVFAFYNKKISQFIIFGEKGDKFFVKKGMGAKGFFIKKDYVYPTYESCLTYIQDLIVQLKKDQAQNDVEETPTQED